MLIVAVIASVIALVLVLVWFSKRRTAAALSATAQFTTNELGGIPLDGNVEVFGTVRRSGEGLIGPLSNTPGVWWRVRVTEHWEERVERTDSDGNTTTDYEERSNVLRDECSDEPFFIEDKFGQVALLPESVDFNDCQRTFHSRDGDLFSDGGPSFLININIGGLGRRNYWVETEEWVFPYDINALTLAHAGQDENGNRFLHHGEGSYQPFIVATDDPEAYAAKSANSARLWGLVAGAAVVASAILLAVALLG